MNDIQETMATHAQFAGQYTPREEAEKCVKDEF